MFRLFKKKRRYFDYASTTPIDDRVLEKMERYLGKKFANPSSLYKEGVETRKAIENSRKTIANILQSKPEEIIFTGGGTEGNNMAILGTYLYQKNVLKKDRLHFITSSIEHSSVLEVFEYIRSLGGKVTYISPEENGIVSLKKIEEAIREDTVLVSLMLANNEIGTIQPIRDLGKLLKSKNILFHTDACQAPNYIQLLVNSLNVDYLTLDGSKIYGPRGSGVLYKRKSVEISPIIFGGGQEGGIRSGTENTASIVGFAEALSILEKERESVTKRLIVFQTNLEKSLLEKVPRLKINGDREKRLPNYVNICLPKMDAEYAVLRMDVLGFCISSVTSCKTLSEDSSSYVIEELYKDQSCSKSSLRITFGRQTTKKDVVLLEKALLTVLK